MAVSRLLPLLTHTQRAALMKHYRELNISHPELMMGAKTTGGAPSAPPAAAKASAAATASA